MATLLRTVLNAVCKTGLPGPFNRTYFDTIAGTSSYRRAMGSQVSSSCPLQRTKRQTSLSPSSFQSNISLTYHFCMSCCAQVTISCETFNNGPANRLTWVQWTIFDFSTGSPSSQTSNSVGDNNARTWYGPCHRTIALDLRTGFALFFWAATKT